MSFKARISAATLALAALAQPQLAVAQGAVAAKPCVSEQEISALAIYAAPGLIQGVSTRCSKNLSSSGFLATQGAALSARFEKRQVEVWPAAKGAMLKLIDKPEQAQIIRQLPDEAVRPFFGPVVSQLLMKDIKPADCGRIERGLSILAPLPVESVGELTGFILSLAPTTKGPKVCPYEGVAAGGKSGG